VEHQQQSQRTRLEFEHKVEFDPLVKNQ